MQTNRSPIAINARILPLVIMGLLVSIYLLHHHLEIKYGYVVGPSICNINAYFDCDTVAKSAFSEILGVPVALFGVAFFASFLLAMFFFKKVDTQIRSFFLALVLITLPFTFYMMWASLVNLGKVCLFCSFLYLLIFVLFGLLLFLGRADGSLQARLGEGFKYLFNTYQSFSGRSWIFASIGIFVFLFFSQYLYVDYILKPRFQAYFDHSIIKEMVQVWSKSEVLFDPVEAQKVKGVISLGSADAKIQLVELSDFECPFCQKVTPIIKNIFLKNKSKLNLVLMNYPLDDKCNKKIQHKMHDFSCELSEYVISESLISSDKGFEAYERIMTEKPQTETEVELIKGDFQNTPEKQALVESYLQEQLQFGFKNGVRGTPDIFVNGKRVPVKNYFQLESVINEIISIHAR